MKKNKIRTRLEINKDYVNYLLSQGVKPLNHYVSNDKEIWVFDKYSTKIYRIAYYALKGEKEN